MEQTFQPALFYKVFSQVVSSLLITTVLMLSGCSGSDGSAVGTDNPTPGGGSASTGSLALSLGWDPVADSTVTGYVIHYGRSSPNSSGSCNYESSLFVSSNEGTVANLSPDTLYYFTVSAYNGIEGPCSSEISTVTRPLPT